MASTASQNIYSDGSPSSSPSVPRQHTNAFQNLYANSIGSDPRHLQAWSTRSTTDSSLSPALMNASHDHRVLKTFAFRGTGLLKRDMQVVAIDQFDNGNLEYSIVVTAWKSKRAGVTLHAGESPTGRVLGVAHFRWNGQVTLGLGDPVNNPMAVVWEEMKKASVWKNKFTFEFTDIDDHDVDSPLSQDHRRRRFLWQRTTDANDGVVGFAAKFTMRNYRLVDQDTGELIAIFLSGTIKNLKDKGKLRIFRKLSPDLEKFVILSWATILEKIARDS